jgi:hypothetical protein
VAETEQETKEKPSSNQNATARRSSLFAYLGHAIRLSHEKMSSKSTATVAHSEEEACKLVESGFDYVCDFNGNKIFRKLKY